MEITQEMIDRLVEYDKKRTDYCVNCKWFAPIDANRDTPINSYGECMGALPSSSYEASNWATVGTLHWCRHHSPIPETEE